MFKRISAILLACFMLFATACAVTPADKGNDVEEDNPLAYTTFRIGCGTGDTMNPTFGATVIGDSILERYDELRTKYNLDIIIETVEKEVDKTDIITKRLAIMQDLFDIFQTAPRYGGISSYKKGVLYAMEEIPTIDSESEKWGYKNHLSSTRFSDGRYYGFFPNEWANAPSFEGILQFNTAMLRSLNIQLPYEYYELKSWNWENFTSVLEQVRDNSENPDEVTPWVAVSFNEDAPNMMFVNGVRSIGKDANDNYTFGFDCPEGLEVLNFLRDMHTKGLYGPQNAKYHEGTAAFLSSSSTGLGGVPKGSVVEEFGIITLPYGPHGSHDAVAANVNWSNQFYFVFNVTDNTDEQMGIFMNELYAPLAHVPDWRTYLINDIFHSDKDYEYYVYMLENCNTDNSTYYGESSLLLDGYFSQCVKGEISPTEVFDKIRTVIQEEIRENTQGATFDISES